MVVKPTGEQYSAESGDYILEPGDNILVPPEGDIPWLEIFSIATQVLTQILAIIAITK